VWRTRLDQRLRPLGLSQGKWTTLVHLARGADKLTQKEIATRIGIEEPTLAGILDRLQQDGWIERKSSPADRRCKTVHLRRRTARVINRIFDTAQELRHELLAGIPQRELDTCARVLSKIRDRADAMPAAAESLNGSKPARSNKNSAKR
jgi:MarR family transcriptional regulator, transcriptional regulator for hemolysin